MLLKFANIRSVSHSRKVLKNTHKSASPSINFTRKHAFLKIILSWKMGLKIMKLRVPWRSGNRDERVKRGRTLYDDSEDEAERSKGKPYIKYDEDAPPRGMATRHYIEVICDSNDE